MGHSFVHSLCTELLHVPAPALGTGNTAENETKTAHILVIGGKQEECKLYSCREG